jgi:hypothetical protein
MATAAVMNAVILIFAGIRQDQGNEKSRSDEEERR